MNDWKTCDGAGRNYGAPDEAAFGLSRRGLLAGVGLGILGWASQKSALAQVSFGPEKESNTVVVVFLRGGADGLNIVVPYGDEDYYRARPGIGIAERDLLKLDDMFGLHPSLRPLMPIYDRGEMAAIHAVGSQDSTRSHFEAMDTMERGLADRQGPSTGWVARYLAASSPATRSPLRAVAFGTTTPASLVGATESVTLSNLSEFRLHADPEARKLMASMYALGKDEVAHAGRETLKTLDTLEKLDPSRQAPRNGATYPNTGLGEGMKQTAMLVRAKVGMEFACLDMGLYDTHVAQGSTNGWLATLLDELGKALAAFAQDLGPDLKRVTVVVMSEFGRRIAENTGQGTDHGHGGAMLLLGGGVKGHQVHADWPGLEHAVGPGDLAVTTDYRDVLSEILKARLAPAELSQVFANYRPSPVGLMQSA